MRVRLKAMVRMPNVNVYIPIGAVMEVLDIRGAYYICRYEENQVIVYKGYVEEIREDGKLEGNN